MKKQPSTQMLEDWAKSHYEKKKKGYEHQPKRLRGALDKMHKHGHGGNSAYKNS